MDTDKLIKKSVEKNFKASVLEISRIGSGASGSVYRVDFENSETIAVKLSPHASLMKQEYEMLSFLKERAHAKNA